MSGFKIAPGFSLPIDFVTQSSAILARRGAGKTHTASVIVEEVVRAGLPVVVLDPTGAWWGLRSSKDGKAAGLGVLILGGEHGDLPLQETAGRVIADQVVNHPGFYVIDLSAFESKGAERRFVAEFLEALYRAKSPQAKHDALLLVVDEADGYAPQNPKLAGNDGYLLRCLGALESIAKRGRIRGLGTLLICQRAASLNKNVLTQIEVLFVMQTTSPQDREAVKAWVEGAGDPVEQKAVLTSMAGLAPGEAWIWSPSWLRVLERVKVRARTTFDSSSTPRAGEKRVEPKIRAAVDLERLDAQIKATAEQAKANDPRELRLQMELMRREIEGHRAHECLRMPEAVRVPMFTPEDLEGVGDLVRHLVAVSQDVRTVADRVNEAIERAVKAQTPQLPLPLNPSSAPGKAPAAVWSRPMTAADLGGGSPASMSKVSARTAAMLRRAMAVGEEPPGRVRDMPDSMKAVRLDAGAVKVLTALVQYPDGRTRAQLAVLTGYAGKGGRFSNILSALRSVGYAEGMDRLRITEQGMIALGSWTPLPTGRALFEYWQGKMGSGEARVLAAVVGAYPHAVDRARLADLTDYEAKGGRFSNILSYLRTLELIEGRDKIRASEALVG